jgi:D-amino-acid dehydrogenase
VTHVAIVGGGVIGLACAHELAYRGCSAVVLERAADPTAGASGGNAGLIVPSHAAPLATPESLRQGIKWLLKRNSPFSLSPTPRLVPWLTRYVATSTPGRARRSTALLRALSIKSLELHHAWVEAGIETGLTTAGVLNVYETDKALTAGVGEAEEHAVHGLNSKVLSSADEVRALEPAVVGPVAGGVFYPGEAHCDPRIMVRALCSMVESAGVQIELGVEVRGVEITGNRAVGVRTADGFVEADVIVLAAGAWTASLARDVGVRLPLEGAKGYHLEVPGPLVRLPVFFQEARVVATPVETGLRLAGTLELGRADERVDQRRVSAIGEVGRRLLGVDVKAIQATWAGPRPCLPDGLPAIGYAPDVPNVIIATGHSMLGLTLAPLTGVVVARLVAGENPGIDLSLLRPSRFGTRRRRED